MRLWQLYDHHDLVIISIEKPDQSQQNAKGIEPPVHCKVHHQLTIGNLAGYAWNVNKMEIWRDTTYESQNPGFELPKSQWVKPLVIEQLAHSHHTLFVWFISCTFSVNEQYFSLTTNQSTVPSAMAYQSCERSGKVSFPHMDPAEQVAANISQVLWLSAHKSN